MMDKCNRFKNMNVKNYYINNNNLNYITNTYLNDIKKYKLLTYEEEQEYIIRIRNQDINSQLLKNKLIGSHQPFVYLFAQKYSINDNTQLMDLIQEGNIGLLTALERFNVKSNVKFLTYANSWIIKYMLLYLDNNNLIQKINNVKYNKINNKIREDFIKKNDYLPSREELILIYEDLGINVKYKEDIDLINLISLNEINNDDNLNLIDDTLDVNLNTNIVHQNLNNILNNLNNVEKLIIEKIFGLNDCVPKNFSEIAKELNIKQHTIKKLYNSGIKNLQKYKNWLE